MQEQSAQPAPILKEYTPPYDMLSDMLFVLALCPTGPLQRTFPAQPFLSLAGRTPLLMWYSRVREIKYWHEEERRQLGDENSILYNELNVLALLRQRALFVPAIYATSDLTIQIGHAYGMPKQKTAMSLEVGRKRLTSIVCDGKRESTLTARLLGPTRPLGRLLSRFWPRWVGPICFPDGRETRALIQATPCAQPAWVRGRLCVKAPWLPTPISLLPIGLYLADQCMTLPPP
ncbi:MAG: hypothetical protein H0T73_08950 [Ardenticatenales bacterium]|nr:hypothetical protein [Ardenticatenales bacterium]